jgi:quercetin dioxygenase-like cupin family protein
MEVKSANWNELPLIPVKEKVTRRVFNEAERCTVTRATLEYGHKPGPHTHEYEQIAMIMQGEADFYIGGVAYPMTAGGIIAIPPNVEHYIVVTSKDTPVINMDIFVPKRSDR